MPAEPGDGAARTFRALTSGPNWTGVHRDRAELPAFTGRPSDGWQDRQDQAAAALYEGHPAGVAGDVGLPEPLPDLVDVIEAPPSLADQVAGLGGRVSALEGMAHSHEVPEPAYSDQVALPNNSLTGEDWDG